MTTASEATHYCQISVQMSVWLETNAKTVQKYIGIILKSPQNFTFVSRGPPLPQTLASNYLWEKLPSLDVGISDLSPNFDDHKKSCPVWIHP